MIDIRTAILRSADHIEANPDLWDFGYSEIPPTCESPGCALGWIHFFSGQVGFHDQIEASYIKGLNCPEGDSQFYARMKALCPEDDRWMGRDEHSCRLAVAALRAYADKYHPAPIEQPMASAWVKEFGEWASSPVPETAHVE